MEYNNEKASRISQPPAYSEYPAGGASQQTSGVVVASSVVQANMGAVVVPVVVAQRMGPQPTPFVCKSCHAQIVTRVETKPTMRTHLFALLLCVVGFWPCVCIPYCVDSCNNADHYCPNCNSYIGSYNN